MIKNSSETKHEGGISARGQSVIPKNIDYIDQKSAIIIDMVIENV